MYLNLLLCSVPSSKMRWTVNYHYRPYMERLSPKSRDWLNLIGKEYWYESCTYVNTPHAPLSFSTLHEITCEKTKSGSGLCTRLIHLPPPKTHTHNATSLPLGYTIIPKVLYSGHSWYSLIKVSLFHE